MINWKVRLRQKPFLVALFSALLLFVQQVANLLGYDVSAYIGDNLVELFNTALFVLTIMGVVIDPTTESVSDSTEAQKYDRPKGSGL